MKLDEAKILTIKDCRLVFGGICSSAAMMTQTQKKMIGRSVYKWKVKILLYYFREWNKDLMNLVSQSLSEELLSLPPNINDEGGMIDYRLSLCLSFFYKFYLQVLSNLSPSDIIVQESSVLQVKHNGYNMTHDHLVCCQRLPHGPIKGCQGFQSVTATLSIGQPVMHLSALQQATGEAMYNKVTLFIYASLS